MRLVTLSAVAYQAIERASVELGPGLNILYGPNDIGKSTLAAALRSVLLVPPASTIAEGFSSWYGDAIPHVSLTFLDGAKHYWKVEKYFGSGSAGAATLSHSKDGNAFTLDCRAREVEERVRALLGWGIPAPGGKGGPKGLPTSFLATVLLGSQTGVDGILGQSLAEDPDPAESGKVRLTKALAVLAQDPIFKQVLDAAQEELNSYFTAKDKKRTGQSSKFTAANNRVKELQREIGVLESELAESTAIESVIVSLRERFATSIDAVHQSSQHLEALQLHAHRDAARRAARAALDAARAELASVDAHAQRIAKADSEIDALKVRVASSEAGAKRAMAELDQANITLRGAEEAHRIATGEGAERERELRRAQCSEKIASATQRRHEVEARRDRIQAVLDARGAVDRTLQAVKLARSDQENATREHALAQSRLTTVEQENSGWRATVAYARWHTAVEASAERARATDQANADQKQADEKNAEAATRESTAAERTAQLSSRSAPLPSPNELDALLQLEHELEVAEAALGGGISVDIKGRVGLAGSVTIDGQEPHELTGLEVEQRLEADRQLLLSIGDLLQLTVRAGAPDKRRAAAVLRTRHSSEVLPVLERAGMKSLAELREELAKLGAERALTDQSRAAGIALRAEAKGLHERAADRRSQAEKLLARGDDVAALRDALGTEDVTALKARFESLGAGAEAKAEARSAQCLTRISEVREALAKREKARTLTEFQLEEANNRENAAQAAYAQALAPLGTEAPDTLLASVNTELTVLRSDEAVQKAELAQLTADSTVEVANITRALTEARDRVPVARQAAERAAATADAARQDQATRQGERSALQEQLESFNRDALNASFLQREAEVAVLGVEPELPPTALDTAQQQLERARREQERTKEELHHAEGKLSSAGGAALRENVERLREALQSAIDAETEVDVEADAWKLLRDTLRTVENEEGAHLGRALAAPLAAKFSELTADRYRTLALSPLLKMDGVSAGTTQATGHEVLAALSVGTRDQLATLVRLAIAEELGSAIILDDHLVHSDPTRLAWFRQALVKTAVRTQVIVLTCRPQDYLTDAEMPRDAPSIDLAGGAIRAIDLSHVVTRYQGSRAQSPPGNDVERARA
ncbi:MAG: hypothetical protein RL685_477 [Pseudomonadota bacterium]|jgi:uncharacterized protein YhaN